MMAVVVWLFLLPFRLLLALGMRGSIILACLLVLAVTAYGVAEDLGLLQLPAQARPAARPPAPSRAATTDIPPGYLRLYQSAARRCPGLSWAVLAGIGKGRAGNAWARFGRDFDRDGRASVYDPGDAIPAAARYLCAHGASRRLDQALYAYNHSWAYVAKVNQLARRYAARGG